MKFAYKSYANGFVTKGFISWIKFLNVHAKAMLSNYIIRNNVTLTKKSDKILWRRELINCGSALYNHSVICHRTQRRGSHYYHIIKGKVKVSLINRLFRHRSKKTLKLRVTGLCVANSPGTGEIPAQMASNAENVSIFWWRHHAHTLTEKSMRKWKHFPQHFSIFHLLCS